MQSYDDSDFSYSDSEDTHGVTSQSASGYPSDCGRPGDSDRGRADRGRADRGRADQAGTERTKLLGGAVRQGAPEASSRRFAQAGRTEVPWQKKAPERRPLAVRACASLSVLEYASVHAVSHDQNLDVPYGASFRGVNFFGIALWGVLSCLLLEEVYCELHQLLLGRQLFQDLAVSGATACYFAFWLPVLAAMAIKVGTSPRAPAPVSATLADLLDEANNGQSNTLAILFLLFLPALPAGLAGCAWERSLTNPVQPQKNLFYVLPHKEEPASFILATTPLLWPGLVLLLLFARGLTPLKYA